MLRGPRRPLRKEHDRLPTAPARTFLTHGDESAAEALRALVQERLGWRASVPMQGETVDL